MGVVSGYLRECDEFCALLAAGFDASGEEVLQGFMEIGYRHALHCGFQC
jgi:hypothetical protein